MALFSWGLNQTVRWIARAQVDAPGVTERVVARLESLFWRAGARWSLRRAADARACAQRLRSRSRWLAILAIRRTLRIIAGPRFPVELLPAVSRCDNTWSGTIAFPAVTGLPQLCEKSRWVLPTHPPRPRAGSGPGVVVVAEIAKIDERQQQQPNDTWRPSRSAGRCRPWLTNSAPALTPYKVLPTSAPLPLVGLDMRRLAQNSPLPRTLQVRPASVGCAV